MASKIKQNIQPCLEATLDPITCHYDLFPMDRFANTLLDLIFDMSYVYNDNIIKHGRGHVLYG